MSASRHTGGVFLVGAGPGDPDLITVKGARALAGADVVVFDRLAAPALLDIAPPHAERIYVGKEPGRAAMSQAAINATLVAHAQRGQRVVRLKGGDPFVFGRGAEEVEACIQAGIVCEVIPGISSAVAAPAAAGIPLTHRSLARSFAVVTGSTADGTTPDLAAIAASVDTVVVLMAAGKVDAACDACIGAGRPATEPAALIQWATTPEERVVISTLSELPSRAAAARLGPPAVLVVGEVAGLPRSLVGSVEAVHMASQEVASTGP